MSTAHEDLGYVPGTTIQYRSDKARGVQGVLDQVVRRVATAPRVDRRPRCFACGALEKDHIPNERGETRAGSITYRDWRRSPCTGGWALFAFACRCFCPAGTARNERIPSVIEILGRIPTPADFDPHTGKLLDPEPTPEVAEWLAEREQRAAEAAAQAPVAQPAPAPAHPPPAAKPLPQVPGVPPPAHLVVAPPFPPPADDEW